MEHTRCPFGFALPVPSRLPPLSLTVRYVTPPSPSPPSPPSGSTPRSFAPSSPVLLPHASPQPALRPSLLAHLGIYPLPSPSMSPSPPKSVYKRHLSLHLTLAPSPGAPIAFSHPRPARLLSWVSPLLSLRPHNLALPRICPPLTCLSYHLNPFFPPPNLAGPARHLPRTASPRLVPMLSLIPPCTLPSPPFPTRPAPPPVARPRPRPSLVVSAHFRPIDGHKRRNRDVTGRGTSRPSHGTLRGQWTGSQIIDALYSLSDTNTMLKFSRLPGSGVHRPAAFQMER